MTFRVNRQVRGIGAIKRLILFGIRLEDARILKWQGVTLCFKSVWKMLKWNLSTSSDFSTPIGCIIFFPLESTQPSVLPHMLHTQHHSLPHTSAHDLGRNIGTDLPGQHGVTVPSGSLFLELHVSFRGEVSLPDWHSSFSFLFSAPRLRDSDVAVVQSFGV